MCKKCAEEYKNDGFGNYENYDSFEDITVFEAVMYGVILAPVVAYIFLKDAVFGGARRRARADRTRLTREQKKIFKDWAGR